MASTSSSTKKIPGNPPKSFLYDVFLSFRGIDTQNNFTSHLYDRLVMAGIKTFMDDDELHAGGEISEQLMRAIKESKIYIIVFSKNYASSTWCLNELVKIMENNLENNHRVVLPVFFRVNPYEVRSPDLGSFAEAFENHENRYATELNKVNTWRQALHHAGGISGFHLERSALGSESRLINLILKEVLSQVKPKRLFVAKYPVGLDSRLNYVNSLIRLESHDVRVFGIWGMGGSGKTVIAKALYNDIYKNFDLSCFLANVREVSHQPNGLVRLQEQLISELVKGLEVVDNVHIGIEMIRQRFCRKKVLIILDDLDELRQLNALAGHRDWFCGGSVIIITTRDQHLLTQVQVDGRYEAKQLNKGEAMELFSRHSFKKGFPEEPYAVIADKIVAYSCGLPLALVVLGSYLLGRPIQQWNSAFESLQRFPDKGIQQILKISYDGLDNDEQREIFLDIACFFIGMDIYYVTDILNGCDFNTYIGIGILIDRCLLTVDRNNELRMHDLLRDMGREIIREPFRKEPGKRSRLWSHQDVTNVLTRNMGTEAIEGVALASPVKKGIHLNTMNFVRMQKLRLLCMDNVNLDGNFEHLSEVIKWISWLNCPLEHLPSTLQMENLVALDMKHGKMTTLWQGNDIQILEHLKILDLSHSKCLTSTPDFTRVPSLVTLVLEDCTSLLQIDQSIGCLSSLLVLNLKGCKKITTIPREVCWLKLLGYLNLSGCSSLKELPQDIGSIVSLRDLYADETAITCLPPSLKLLRNLTSLSLRGCTKMSGNANALLSIVHRRPYRLPSIRRLNLRDCYLSDEDIPEDMGNQFGLKELDLAGNRLSKLPSSFRGLRGLESLWLDDWNILQSIPRLPPNLKALITRSLLIHANRAANRGNRGNRANRATF